MNPLFWYLLGVIALLGIAGGILIFTSEKSRIRHMEQAFLQENCMPTKKLGDIWLDATARRWAIAHASKTICLHHCSDIVKIELVQDDESYVVHKGAIETHLGGIFLWAILSGERRKEKTIRRLLINIFLSDRSCPIETLILCNTPLRVRSAAYRKLSKQAASLLEFLDSMKNID